MIEIKNLKFEILTYVGQRMPRRPKFSDLALLKLLRENARMTYVELARRLGVSDTAVRKRMKRLEALGVIRRYTIEIDPRVAGLVMAFIGIDVRPEKYVEILEQLKRMSEVVSLYATSGDHNIMAECWFESHSDFVDFVRRLAKLDGVTRVCPAVVTEKVK